MESQRLDDELGETDRPLGCSGLWCAQPRHLSRCLDQSRPDGQPPSQHVDVCDSEAGQFPPTEPGVGGTRGSDR